MRLFNAVIDYFRSSKAEFTKVSWPSRQETVRYTSLVIGVSIVLAVFFASLDFGLTRLVNAAILAKQNAAVPKPAETAPPAPAAPPGLNLEPTTSTPFFPSTSTQP